MSDFVLRQYPGGFYSVTSIINYVFGVPEGIVRWSVKSAADAILRAISESQTMPSKKSLLEIGENERLRLLREAGKKGTVVHNAIQDKMEGKRKRLKIEDEYSGYYNGFLDFLKNNPLKPILQEEVVYSERYKFAGRFDMYCKLWGKNVLIDYKTSNHLRSEYGLQLAAYAHCLEELGHPVEAKYILHLKKDGMWEMVRYDDELRDFLAVREVFERKMTIEQPKFEVASDYNALRKERKDEKGISSPV